MSYVTSYTLLFIMKIRFPISDTQTSTREKNELRERFKSFNCFSEVLLIHTGLWNLFGDLMRRDFLVRLLILLVLPGGQI